MSNMEDIISNFIKAMTAYGGDCTDYEGYWGDDNIALFESWLKEQPKVDGKTLYRGYQFNRQYYEDGCIKEGAIIGVDALTQEALPSFTSGQIRATIYMNEFGEIGLEDTIKVLFVIHTHGKSFVDISKLSYYKEEDEYKCTNDVRLAVKSITRRSFMQIECEEL